MKYIEIDRHYIRDKFMSRVIFTPHVASSHQLADVFTKSLAGISSTSIKLDMFDLYALASGRVSNNNIGLSAHLGHLLFNLYIRTYVLSFGYTILGLSYSRRQQPES